MNSFWKGGIQNLENEMEAYDILSMREEGVGGESESEDCGNDVEAPAMQVDFDGIQYDFSYQAVVTKVWLKIQI